jgi:hypothetical protein
MVTGYEIEDWDSVPGRNRNFYLHRYIQSDSGSLPASY